MHDLAERDREGADLWLRKTQEDLVIDRAGEGWAVELGRGQRDVELDH